MSLTSDRPRTVGTSGGETVSDYGDAPPVTLVTAGEYARRSAENYEHYCLTFA